MNITPAHDYLLVEVESASEAKLASGIVVPMSANKARVSVGVVSRIGDAVKRAQPTQRVAFHRNAGVEVDGANPNVRLLRDEEILGTVE